MITASAQENMAEAWAVYLDDLEALLRPRFTDEQWAGLFHRTDTPAQAAEKMRGLTVVRAPETSKPGPG